MSPRLTELAHARMRTHLAPGDVVVDGTAGNGFDTAFLAACVGPHGRVFAFDIQAAAIASTRVRLAAAGLVDRVGLIEADHAALDAHLDSAGVGTLKGAMFNLGFLPGSDKVITTQPTQTIIALAAALRRLAPGGLVSVLVYRHHEGGAAEFEAVSAWMAARANEGCSVEQVESPGPTLYLLSGRDGDPSVQTENSLGPR